MAQGRRRSGPWARRQSVAVRSSEVIGLRVRRETADKRTGSSDADHGTGPALFWRVTAAGAGGERRLREVGRGLTVKMAGGPFK
jgi:hypothetical protein